MNNADVHTAPVNSEESCFRTTCLTRILSNFDGEQPSSPSLSLHDFSNNLLSERLGGEVLHKPLRSRLHNRRRHSREDRMMVENQTLTIQNETGSVTVVILFALGPPLLILTCIGIVVGTIFSILCLIRYYREPDIRTHYNYIVSTSELASDRWKSSLLSFISCSSIVCCQPRSAHLLFSSATI